MRDAHQAALKAAWLRSRGRPRDRRRAAKAAQQALAKAWRSEELHAGGPAKLLWKNPVLQKELRATSRRRRYFALRFAFLLALTAFVAVVWQAEMDTPRSGATYKLTLGLTPPPDMSFHMTHIAAVTSSFTAAGTLLILAAGRRLRMIG